MPKFKITTGQNKTFTYDINRDIIIIGRSEDNDIILSERNVSRRHTEVRKAPDGYLLVDLNSQNGTELNGIRVTRQILKNNDHVKIGSSTLTFLDESVKPAVVDKQNKAPAYELHAISEKIPITDEDIDQKLIASIHGESGIIDDKELLSRIELKTRKTKHESKGDLEKSNKILYVLYQISRKLNRTADFDEQLNTIMDLIFQVIDADHGFVVVLGNTPEKIIPKVVKYKIAKDSSSHELRVSRTIMEKVVNEKTSVLTSNAMEDSQFDGAESILVQNIRSIMSVPLWRKNEVIGMIQIESFSLYNVFTKANLDLLAIISSQMAMVIEQANLNEKIRREEMARSRLERFHSPEVVDLITSGEELDEETLMAPKEMNATILFTDIVSFTPLSERLQPAEISRLLNLYFRKMTDIIFENKGTLDKYIGDAIMAVFGAPIERDDDAENAVRAALEMRKILFQMMKSVEPDRRFDIRTGINSGKVVAGNLGSPKRMDYTVIGDTVNTASRLESIAQPKQIVIGEKTYQLVKNKFNINEVGPKSVKGKRDLVMVYEVLD